MKFYTLIFCLLLSACSSLPKTPDGYAHKTAVTENFSLHVWEKDNIQKQKPLRFYIQGNGSPTPDKPIALRLAENDSYQNIIVLSRPCQYEAKSQVCQNEKIWGEEQYNPEILKEIEEVIVFYMQRYKTNEVEFVAYDGGAPIAFNLASKLKKVNKIITIAGILDIDAYTRNNNLAPFTSAQNPAQNGSLIAKIPQIHYVGSDDKITTQAMAERFVSKLPNPRMAVVKVVFNTNHTNWDDIKLDY